MKKKFGLYIVSFVMAVLIAVLSPLQIFAATKTEYIQEIRIGYGADGKDALTKAGYTVIDYDVNEGGKGSAVYLGYKTTDKKEDAITDLAIMPMRINGKSPFSFDDYAKEMENLSDQIDQMLADFDEAIREFRANLKKPAPQNEYAQLAYEMLNQYVEDDSGLGVGELFAREQLDDTDTDGSKLYDTYHKILMTGNSIAVAAIQTALALGCTETSGETFLTRLANGTYTGEVDEEYNEAINILAQNFSAFRSGVLAAKSVHDAACAYQGGVEAYVGSLEESDQKTALKQITLVEILSKVDYADLELDGKQLTFLDVAMLPTDVTAGQVCLTASMLEPLAKAMTPGQIAISRYTSLEVLISNAFSTSFSKTTGEDGKEHYDLGLADGYLHAFQQQEKISVYIGVDRSIFDDKNYHTVAITDAAIRSNALSDSFGVQSDYMTSGKYIAVGAAGASVAAIGCITLIAACTKIGTVAEPEKIMTLVYSNKMDYFKKSGELYYSGTEADFTAAIERMKNDGEIIPELISKPAGDGEVLEQITEVTTYSTSIGTKVAATVGAIAMAIGIALAIYGFVMAKKAAEPKKVEYDPIPRAIVDVRSTEAGEDKYFVYYAARLVNASDDYINEKDTTKLYGDLNGLSGYEQWACLYYAKDLRIGSPLTTTKILVQNKSSLSSLQISGGYVPIHGFFDNTLTANYTDYTPMNMNEYSTNSGASKTYVFFKRDLKVEPLASTIIDGTASFNWLALVAFCVGAGLATGATWFVVKRKKKANQEA